MINKFSDWTFTKLNYVVKNIYFSILIVFFIGQQMQIKRWNDDSDSNDENSDIYAKNDDNENNFIILISIKE